jgi:lipopolysaccharide export system permease protein
MKVNSIVSRYVFKEMIPPFLINLVLFTFIFLMARILDITDLVVNHGVSVSSVLLMLICSIPSFLVFIVPMSIMMGVLLAFLRLSSDNEITALKSAGLSVYMLLSPVLVFCLIGCLVTGFMCVYGSPWGKLSFKALLFEAAKSNINIGLKERTFNDSFKDVMLYVGKIDTQDNTLSDVFIEDRQTPGTVNAVVAPKGRLFCDPERLAFRLTLFNGIINKVDQENKTANSVSFDTYDFELEAAEVLSTRERGRKSRGEMSLGELRQGLREATKKNAKYYLMLMEYHKKFSIPFACFVFGLVAVPLGIQSKSAKRFFGVVLGLFFFLIYYIFLSAGWVFGEAGVCPPVVAMWGPNVVIGGVGLYLLILSAKEHPLKGISVLPRIFMRQRFVCTE